MNRESPARPAVLSLCDYSGVMVAPWVAAGFDAWLVDLAHPEGVHRGADGIVRVGADVRSWEPPAGPWVFAAAFPPCTDLAVSGARWFRSKGLRALAEAIDTFGACVETVERLAVPACVENPVSAISSHYRPPDFTFDPCDYGDPYTKRTCLWGFGGFRMPPKAPVFPVKGSMMHTLPATPDRARLRSVTPAGFARAVFQANAPTAAVVA